MMLFEAVNTVSPTVINTALLVLSSLLAFLTGLYFTQRKENYNKSKELKEENEKVKTRLSDLEGRLALVNAAVVPISTAFQAILIKELTHLHTPEMDELLVKVGPPFTLTLTEINRLHVLLQERAEDMGPEISDSERDAALMLPAVMKRVRVEQETMQSDVPLQLRLMAVAAVIGPGASGI